MFYAPGSEGRTWEGSKDYCRNELDGNLITIRDALFQVFVAGLLAHLNLLKWCICHRNCQFWTLHQWPNSRFLLIILILWALIALGPLIVPLMPPIGGWANLRYSIRPCLLVKLHCKTLRIQNVPVACGTFKGVKQANQMCFCFALFKSPGIWHSRVYAWSHQCHRVLDCLEWQSSKRFLRLVGRTRKGKWNLKDFLIITKSHNFTVLSALHIAFSSGSRVVRVGPKKHEI